MAGRIQEAANSAKVLEGINSFMTPTGEIDVSRMINEWFPIDLADVFISHARADKDIALTISGILSNKFGLKPFVDSCVWSHANSLLRSLDEAYCKTGENLFSYERSMITASHVHMMLCNALTKMMDCCECVLFLNTGNAINPVSVKDMAQSNSGDITSSPWLFHEISMMKLLRRRKIEDHRKGHQKRADFSESTAKLPGFSYPTELGGIPTLKIDNLKKWLELWSNEHIKQTHPLDFLYIASPPHSTNLE